MKVIYNARIYTMDRDYPLVTALVIDADRIIAVGEDRTILESYQVSSSKVELINLHGKTILPGLVDGHIHLEKYALGLQKVNCETVTRLECLQNVSERVAAASPGEWILGHGWNQNNWPEGFGNKTDLDEIANENPIYLTAKSLHAAWVNSAALRLANLTDSSPDPVGGRLGRDEWGRLNGILFESAMDLVGQIIPEPSIEQTSQAIEAAQPILWNMGLTGVHDFDRDRCFSALQVLRQEEKLHLRVLKSIPLENLQHAVALGLRTGFGDNFLRIGGVKAFADGALGPQTAGMLQPYLGSDDNRGMLLMDAEELSEHGRVAISNGLSLAVHAIGDRANHEVLTAFDHLRDYEAGLFFNGRRENAILCGLRHRIEHVQLIHPEDAPRLAQSGIIASMQPIHATSDMLMADRYWGDRAEYSYAYQTQLSYGANLVFGSDAPVESPNPFWGIHAAVTRQRQDGTPDKNGWRPAQRVSVSEAIYAYTVGAAYAAGFEKKGGMLKPGYLADLIVVSDNPFTCDPSTIYSINSMATMVGGTWVYWNMH